jgi:hypothetical protein
MLSQPSIQSDQPSEFDKLAAVVSVALVASVATKLKHVKLTEFDKFELVVTELKQLSQTTKLIQLNVPAKLIQSQAYKLKLKMEKLKEQNKKQNYTLIFMREMTKSDFNINKCLSLLKHINKHKIMFEFVMTLKKERNKEYKKRCLKLIQFLKNKQKE